MKKNIRMINNIQFLRCFAALYVVMYHIPAIIKKYDLGTYDPLEVGHWGAFGVDIFFVISGYIMAKISSKKDRTATSFMKERATRILPLYISLTLLLVFIQHITPTIFNTLYDSRQNIGSLLLISHFIGYDYPTLYVGWSLELEMFFYVCFAFSMLAKNENTRIALLLTLIFLSLSLGFIFPISIEFMYGILIYKIEKSVGKLNVKPFWFYFSFIFLSIIAIMLNSDASPNSTSRPFTYGAISFFIVLSAVLFKDTKKSFITTIGDSTYSIYLTQVFSIPLAIKVASALHLDECPQVIFFVTLLVVTAIGMLSYIFLEKNINKIFKSLNSISSKH